MKIITTKDLRQFWFNRPWFGQVRKVCDMNAAYLEKRSREKKECKFKDKKYTVRTVITDLLVKVNG